MTPEEPPGSVVSLRSTIKVWKDATCPRGLRLTFSVGPDEFHRARVTLGLEVTSSTRMIPGYNYVRDA